LSCSGVMVLLALAGCSSSPSPGATHDDQSKQKTVTPTPTGLDDLPLPTDGFQVRSLGADINPGEDVEYCEVTELPGTDETYYVGEFELANGPHSHHLVVATAQPGSDADTELRTMNVGDKVVCNGANLQFPEDGLTFLGSAQTPYLLRSFPKGVGMVLHGGQRAVFDYHYLNVSEDVIHAESAFNVHLVDAATVKHIATAFSFFNFTVDVPALSTQTFTAECHFDNDLMLASLVRHTHQQGRDFSVWNSGGAKDGQFIWTSHDWKNEPGYDFPEPSLVKSGEGFKFSCTFENPNNAPPTLRHQGHGRDVHPRRLVLARRRGKGTSTAGLWRHLDRQAGHRPSRERGRRIPPGHLARLPRVPGRYQPDRVVRFLRSEVQRLRV